MSFIGTMYMTRCIGLEEELQQKKEELEAKAADPDIGKGTADTFARITGYCRCVRSGGD